MYQHTQREENAVRRQRTFAATMEGQVWADIPSCHPGRPMVTRKHNYFGGGSYNPGRPCRDWTIDQEMAAYVDARPLEHRRNGSRFEKAARKAAIRQSRVIASRGNGVHVIAGHLRLNAVPSLLATAV